MNIDEDLYFCEIIKSPDWTLNPNGDINIIIISFLRNESMIWMSIMLDEAP